MTATAGSFEALPVSRRSSRSFDEPAPASDSAIDLPAIARSAPAPRIAVGILCFALSAVLLQTTVNLVSARPGVTMLVSCLACFAPIFAIQLVHTLPRAKRLRERFWVWTLPAQAALTYAPILIFGRNWGAAAGFLGGSVLLLLPGRVSWVCFGLVAVSMGAVGVATRSSGVDVLYMVVSTMMSALMVFGTSRLSDLVTELHHAREQLARDAVGRERRRFARDLHDLLGYSLSTITLKSEVAIRTAGAHPDRTREELAAILEISRQALADVRAVTSGYRDMSLASEAASTAAVLALADISAEVEIDCGPVPGAADTVLATVLREGVTNMLRHSKVRNCRIEAHERGGRVSLRIVNDGLDAGARTAGRWSEGSGSGISNLSSRVREVGGRLTAGVREDGRFQLAVEIPRDGSDRR